MPKLLIIGFVWPEPKSSAAGSRMLQLIDCFKQLDYSITFASACAKTNNAFNLESIHVAQEAIQLNNSSFNSFIKDLNPEVVLFDRFMTEEQFGWRVTETCPHAIKILDTEDLHCLRKGRHQALKDNKPFDDKYLFNDFAKREIASIYRCDLTLMISEVEIEILKEKFKVNASLLLYLPFLLDELSETQSRQLPDFQSRTNFMTIGNFLHEPNYDAILYLKQDIWPLIKKNIAHAELHIYGAYQSQKATQLNNENEGFIIKGFAEDVYETLLNYRVNLAALRFGAGLKGKLTDAMISGTPCLMTSIAAEGIFGDLNANGFIEDSIENFAKKSLELYTNKKIWELKQKNGFSVISKRFSKNNYISKLEIVLNDLVNNLETHRLNNFTGIMLHYHSMQSSKYMSRWIEEKNKK